MLLLVSVSVIEDDLHVPVAAGRTCRCNRLTILSQLEAWTHERRELYLRRDAKRELETLYALTFILLDPIGVRADKLDLLVPKSGEVQATARAGHPYKRYLSAGTG